MRRLRSPAFVEPMAAKVVSTLPEGAQWLYEVKWDGYRALILKDGDRVRIRSRRNNDLSATYPAVAAAAARLDVTSAVIDGEIVAVDAGGRPSFQALQHRTSRRDHTIVFYAFDLLLKNGEWLAGFPLRERRALLAPLLKDTGLLFSDELRGSARDIVHAVSRLGLEGVVAKRRDSRYDPGQRSGVWVKLKLDRQQEFVVGGYRPGSHGIDALLVGVYDGRRLMFAGKVRAGFTPHTRREVGVRLQSLHSTRSPFADLPTARPGRWGSGVTADQMHEMQWVKPEVVAQIRFVEWTSDGLLRHAAFLGLRTDMRAAAVRRES